MNSPANQDNAVIARVSGPIVTATGMFGAHMYEVVEVGEAALIGEIVRLADDRATIQVYEDTTMLKPGAPVRRTGAPLSLQLGPGLIGNIYDGIQRSLPDMHERSGALDRPRRKSPAPGRGKALDIPADGNGRSGNTRRTNPGRSTRDVARYPSHSGSAGRFGQVGVACR